MKKLIALLARVAVAAVGMAALSFCRLLDGFRSGAPWAAASYDVHLGSLQLLAQPDSTLDAKARAQVVEGLNTVVKRATG